MDQTVYVIFKVQFDFALEVCFSIVRIIKFFCIVYIILEGESRKSLPVLEVTVAGFEMKTCRNAIVTASSGTISSVQTLIYTTCKYWSKTKPGSYN